MKVTVSYPTLEDDVRVFIDELKTCNNGVKVGLMLKYASLYNERLTAFANMDGDIATFVMCIDKEPYSTFKMSMPFLSKMSSPTFPSSGIAPF